MSGNFFRKTKAVTTSSHNLRARIDVSELVLHLRYSSYSLSNLSLKKAVLDTYIDTDFSTRKKTFYANLNEKKKK